MDNNMKASDLTSNNERILHFEKVKGSCDEYRKIIYSIIESEDLLNQASSKLYAFYGELDELKALRNEIVNKCLNCITLTGNDKKEDSFVLLFNASNNIHPLIPVIMGYDKTKKINASLLDANDGSITTVEISSGDLDITIFTIIINAEVTVQDSKKIMDITFIHKYLLLCYRYNARYENFYLNIIMLGLTTDDPENTDALESNRKRLQIYTYNVDHAKVKVTLNGVKIYTGREIKDFSMLMPAVYVNTEEDYQFLKHPLEKSQWDTIKEGKFDMPVADAKKKFYPYMKLCTHAFFKEFERNESKAYTLLRYEAYSSDVFYEEYVSKMPFLALILFALYDYFFRNESLLKLKEKIGGKTVVIQREDCLLSLQGSQDRKRYEIYKDIKNKYDIKNLIDYDPDDKINPVFQQTVIAEMFECVSIAEGLLQIIENAVLHAHGGLLSMRVYSRAYGSVSHAPIRPQNIEYLDKVYGRSYFHFQDTPFFLEVQLSDFSDKSMPEKYIDNILADEVIKKGLMDKIRELEISRNERSINTDIDGQESQGQPDIDQTLRNILKKIRMNFFFSEPADEPSEEDISLKEFKQCYYSLSESVVHHFGLEIFNAIVTARNGIFSVCGNNDYYSNAYDILNERVYDGINKINKDIHNDVFNQYLPVFEDAIKKGRKEEYNILRHNLEKNKNLPGISYRILLPLTHVRATDLNAVDVPDKKDNPFIPKNTIVHIKDKPLKLDAVSTSIMEKQKKINYFAEHLQNKYLDEKDKDKNKRRNMKHELDSMVITCIDIQEIMKKREYEILPPDLFEVIVKGTLLFALRLSKDEEAYIPIAIINLTPFQFIEAARIIAVYCAKNSRVAKERQTGFEKKPIYLKCKNEPIEMVFADTELNIIKDSMLRTAIKSGSMFDEIDTIAFIFEKLISSKKTNGGAM